MLRGEMQVPQHDSGVIVDDPELVKAWYEPGPGAYITLCVYASTAVRRGHRAYGPVRELLDRTRGRLVRSEIFEDVGMLFAEARLDLYEVRAALPLDEEAA